MFSPPLGRHAGHRSFNNLKERLLYAFPRHVSCDRRILGLLRDFIDLIDVNDPTLRALYIAVRRLNDLEKDILHILTYISGLSKRGGIRDRKWDIQNPG